MGRTVLLLLLLVGCVSSETVLERLSSSPQLAKFWEIISSVEEVRNLFNTGDASYTIFAPTNEAIRNFMVPGVEGILQKDPEALRKLVAYHVAVSEMPVRTTDVPAAYAGMLTTMYGRKLLLETSEDTVKVNSKAKIIEKDAVVDSADKGGKLSIVHVVDTVLSYPGWFPEEDLVTLLRKPKELRAFYATIWEVREELGLTQHGPITLFVPSNTAFARAGLSIRGTPLLSLLDADRELFMRILRYHIVYERYMTTEELSTPTFAKTLDVHEGTASMLVFQKDATGSIDINQGVSKVDAAKRRTTGVPALNGVYYVVDRLLLPPGVEIPDVNYSFTRHRYLEQARAKQETPEPLSELVVDVDASPEKDYSRRLPLVYLLVVLVALLLYLFAIPSHGLKIARRRQQPDYLLFVFGILLVVCFTLPGFKWMLPPALRWSTDELRIRFTRSVHGTMVGTQAQAALSDTVQKNKEQEAKLRVMLKQLNREMYYQQLVDYGLDRVGLVAIATIPDGVRAGVRQAHWTDIVKEARQRTNIPPAQLDITPEPEMGRFEVGGRRTPVPDETSRRVEGIISDFKNNNGEALTRSPDGPQLPPLPTPKPVIMAPPPNPEDKLKKFVLAAIIIPSTGGSTLECTFGTKHGSFAHRDNAQLSNIKYVPVKNLMEAKELRAQLGKKDYKDVSPNAKIITTMVATRHITRFLRAFHKSIGKTNTAESDFRCDGKLQQTMKDPKFSLEKFVKLPEQGRRLCEYASNPMVKALVGTPPGQQSTEDMLEIAKKNLESLDVLMIEENFEKKSMLWLMTKLNISEGSYIPCAPFDDPGNTELSLRATDVIARDNNHDRLLYAEISHFFHTKYAGLIEMYKDASTIECNDKPTVCFDENDRNGERKAKDLFINVNTTLKRASSRASVMCAGYCRVPKSGTVV